MNDGDRVGARIFLDLVAVAVSHDGVVSLIAVGHLVGDAIGVVECCEVIHFLDLEKSSGGKEAVDIFRIVHVGRDIEKREFVDSEPCSHAVGDEDVPGFGGDRQQ